MLIQTEYEFELPYGYADEGGTLHKRGIMRLACAADEILPMSDIKVQQNPAYLTVIILSRVITKLGTLPQVNTKIIEKLYTADLAYLQDLYQRINQSEAPVYKAVCPKCGEEAEFPINFFLREE